MAPDETPELADPTQRRYRGCAAIKDFEITAKLGEGTFGVVSKGRSKRTGAVVALKKILMHNERDGFPITALREIKLLKMLSHPNVLKLDEMAVERKKGDGKKRATMYMITPYMDHDLTGMTTNPDINFTIPQIKCYMMQLLQGLSYLHASNILHRDMKAANLLINNKGVLQIADFGLARHYDGPTPRAGAGNGIAVRDYTCLVVTRWYRPPELLLQFRRYTPAIDMWGAGCVFAEMFERKPILEGKTDINQAEIIFDLLGSPTEETMPGWSALPGCEGVKDWGKRRTNITTRFKHLGPEGLDLLQKLLKLDYSTRINAIDALKHNYFTTPPLPSRPEDLPKFEESHELDRRKHQEKRTARPPAPAGGAVGMGPDEAWAQNAPPNGAAGRNGVYAGFDDRGRYPPPPSHNRDRDRAPPVPPPATTAVSGHALPPRPPVPIDARLPAVPSYRDRGDDSYSSARRPAWQQPRDTRAIDPPPSRPPSHAADIKGDRYVPSYEAGGAGPALRPPTRARDDDLPPRRDRVGGGMDSYRVDRDRDHRDFRDDRERDRRRTTRSRSPDRGVLPLDRDRLGGPSDRDRIDRDRVPDRDNRDFRDRERDRDGRDRDRDRDVRDRDVRDRDRDVYRR